MKYKNINSAVHNFGHSFFSLMNYIDGVYVIDELVKIHTKKYNIKINWLNKEFEPKQMLNDKIKKSIIIYANSIENSLLSQHVELKKLTSLYFIWNANEKDRFMLVTDDRQKNYKILITNTI